jgi:D-methionine transport system substrate-binding protein
MSRWIKIFLLSFLVAVSACKSQDKNVLRVGTIAGPESQLMEAAKNVAKNSYGLDVEIVEFTDYSLPNAALNDGSIDANMFQHEPFLQQQIKDRNYHLAIIGKSFVYPMGIYANKIKTLNNIPQGAIVGIPNDVSNEGRALLLLQKAGLIELKKSAGMYATPADIEKNPSQLVFKELDAAQLVRSLPDVDIAIINTNYAIPAKLSPEKDAIFKENSDSPYANVVVVREADINDPRMKHLVAAIQSNAVAVTAKKIFDGYAIPAWR